MESNHEKLDEQIKEIVVGSIIERKNNGRDNSTKNTKSEVIKLLFNNQAVIRDCYDKVTEIDLEEFELSPKPIFKIGDLVKDKNNKNTDVFWKIAGFSSDRKKAIVQNKDDKQEIYIWDLELVSDLLVDELVEKAGDIAQEAHSDFGKIKARAEEKQKAAA